MSDEHLPEAQAAFDRLSDQAADVDTMAAARRAIEHRSRRRRQGLGALAVVSAAVVALVAFVVPGSDDPDQDVATPVASTTTPSTSPSTELSFTSDPLVPADEFLDQLWLLDTVTTDGQESPADGDPATLFLDSDGAFHGSTGRRSRSGEYVLEGAWLSFRTTGGGSSCPPELRVQDRLLRTDFGDGVTVSVDDGRLRLTSSNDRGFSRMSPSTAPPSPPMNGSRLPSSRIGRRSRRTRRGVWPSRQPGRSVGALRVSQLRSAAAADSFLRSRAAVPSWPTDVDLTSEDEDLVAAFHAIDGSGPIDVALPLAESGVQLELGQYLLATRSPDELTDPEAWTLDLEQNPTYAGPTSPLGLLAGPGETTVVVGRHAHCPSAPMPVHPDLQALRRISLQPSDIESCHQWHAVDLYIDDVGDVAAITLEAYEP